MKKANKIFLAGGRGEGRNSMHQIIECYDVENDYWEDFILNCT
jgi:hypothetical protein